MKFAHCFLIALLTIATLTGCAPTLSPDTYATSDAGQIKRMARGVILSSRIVKVSDDGRGIGVGTVTGGALGALAGSQVGQGRGSLAAGIGGALLGGIAGSHVQQGLTTQSGMEYVIKLRDGSLLSIVQSLVPSLQRGQRVLVQFGADGRSRVIADPAYDTRY